jgi:hypothetical protein
MRIKVQLLIESAGLKPTTVEITTIERKALDAGSLGLHMSEAKTLLQALQSSMVSAQVAEFLDEARICPECQARRSLKDHHEIVYRSVFGKLRLDSPRLYHCHACDGSRRSFSPLAERLPERSSPELQYLQSKFSALMSYGLTIGVLGEVLPLDNVLAVSSVRRQAKSTSSRLKRDQQDDHTQAICRFELPQPYIPQPSPVKAIGVDGGYVRLAGHASRHDGWFEVIVGKSQRDDGEGGCFAYVHRLEPDPSRRMEHFFTQEGIRRDQPVTFLSDGGDTVRQGQFGPGRFGEWILDWFHIAMRFQNLIQIAKGLPEGEDLPRREQIVRDLEGAKWHLWHGCWYRCINRLESLTFDAAAFDMCEAGRKLAAKLDECITYLERNRGFIVDYGDRYRHGEVIASSFVESAVNQVVSKRFCKKQQMSWSPVNADCLLQVRTAVLNEKLRSHFVRWYPSLAPANEEANKMAA